MRREFLFKTLPICVAVIAAGAWFTSGGSLTPPVGPVAGTMKTLQQVEPRRPIGQSDVPFTINSAGSYYLTENLYPTGPHGAMITITVDNVTLDLMGFTIYGTSEVGTASDGIRASGTIANVVVRNGFIRSCTNDGIDFTGFGFAYNAVVEGIVATNNAGRGIGLGARSSVNRCVARSNTGNGIVASESLVTACMAIENGGTGIDASGLITDCFVHRNTGDGIQVSSDSLVRGNVCDKSGIGAGSGAGIHVTSSNTLVDGNTVTDNDRGIDVDLSGNTIVRNSAGQNGTNYDIVAGNSVGPSVTSANIAASTNPHGNYDN